MFTEEEIVIVIEKYIADMKFKSLQEDDKVFEAMFFMYKLYKEKYENI